MEQDLTVKFLRDGKLLIKFHGQNAHLTLHPGHNSGVIDLHRTNELCLRGDPSRHETIGTLTKAELVERMWQFRPDLCLELPSLRGPSERDGRAVIRWAAKWQPLFVELFSPLWNKAARLAMKI